MSTAAAMDLSAWDRDPKLYLFTSLTSGSSQIFTATSRMELILKANKIPFLAIDVATDEMARKLWGRRAGKKKLPGLVKEGYVIADINEVEDWNEFGELKEQIGPVPGADAGPAPTVWSKAAPAQVAEVPEATKPSANDPMRDLAAQAASIGQARQKGPTALVDSSKIRTLDGKAPLKAETDAAEAAPKTPSEAAQEGEVGKAEDTQRTPSVAVTDAPKPETIPADTESNADSGPAPATSSASDATHTATGSSTTSEAIARDPTDPVPSAGDPPSVAHHEHESANKLNDAAAAEAFYSRDPTDPVPSAGTPIAAVSPSSGPVANAALSHIDSAAASSDSIAGGKGLAESAEDLPAATTEGITGSQGLAKSASDLSAVESTSSLPRRSGSWDLGKLHSSSSSSSLPAGARAERHRGSDVRAASREEIQEIENAERIDEGDETEETDTSQQPAAAGDKAGVSVLD